MQLSYKPGRSLFIMYDRRMTCNKVELILARPRTFYKSNKFAIKRLHKLVELDTVGGFEMTLYILYFPPLQKDVRMEPRVMLG